RKAAAIERRHRMSPGALEHVGGRHLGIGQAVLDCRLRIAEIGEKSKIGREIVALREHAEARGARSKQRLRIGKSSEGRLRNIADYGRVRFRRSNSRHSLYLTNHPGHVTCRIWPAPAVFSRRRSPCGRFTCP